MPKERILEIDFLRSVAILLMVTFHLVYDLAVFYQYPLDYATGFWFWVGRSSAVLFIIISGVSSNFSAHLGRRALKVLAAAMLITAVTYFWDLDLYVRFGILHLLGVSMLAAVFFRRLNIWAAVLGGLLLFALGYVLDNYGGNFSSGVFLPLGIIYPGFRSIDYYPLVPWAGIFLWGISLGKAFYPEKKSFFRREPHVIAGLNLLGRHSLLIYLVHQPIILGILFLLNPS